MNDQRFSPNMNDLISIEMIKQLKGRYFRLIDSKQWEELLDVFTDDYEVEWIPQNGDRTLLSGPAEAVAFVRAFIGDSTSIHHGHMPEIEIVRDDYAQGTWSMCSLTISPTRNTESWGRYYEEYRKDEAGRWRIARLRLHGVLNRSVSSPLSPAPQVL